MKPLVYVAGPITGDPFGCVRRATEAWEWLRNIGCVPFLPQLSVLHEMIDPQPYETWLTYDLDVIERCDAILRLTGHSPGADREVGYALDLGLPVFCDADCDGEHPPRLGRPWTDLASWAATWTPAEATS